MVLVLWYACRCYYNFKSRWQLSSVICAKNWDLFSPFYVKARFFIYMIMLNNYLIMMYLNSFLFCQHCFHHPIIKRMFCFILKTFTFWNNLAIFFFFIENYTWLIDIIIFRHIYSLICCQSLPKSSFSVCCKTECARQSNVECVSFQCPSTPCQT